MSDPNVKDSSPLFDFADLQRKISDLVDFAKASKVATGFGYMGPEGVVSPESAAELWITCRMTHVFSLAHLLGIEGAKDFAEHGVQALSSFFHDPVYGGWFSKIEQNPAADGAGVALSDAKEAYAHAFVLLAANSAMAANIVGAETLLSQAAENQTERWWVEEDGRVVEAWDQQFETVEQYRGLNSNMHTVEAYISVFDSVDDRDFLDRAQKILEFVAHLGASHNWRLPEHFTSRWFVEPSYNHDRPADPFRPFGATPGHGFEWARLMLHARSSLIRVDGQAPDWMLTSAMNLYRRAASDGWFADGNPGFVYTTDLGGMPVVRERMHWVAFEAINAAIVLLTALQEQGIEEQFPELANDFVRSALVEDIKKWWAYTQKYFFAGDGKWIHELNSENERSQRTWPGYPDAYHVLQMLVLPMIAGEPTFAEALRQRATEEM